MIFANITEIRRYVNGLDASVSFDTITPSLRSAERYVRNILTPGVFDNIIGEGNPLLEEAIASYMMYNYASFDAIAKRKQGTEIYKYELERIRAEFLNSYQGAMDELFRFLDTNSTEWTSTLAYIQREQLLVSDVYSFNKYYPIDNSYYFFMLMVPVQNEVLDLHFKDIPYKSLNDNDKLCRACVLFTLSKSLERFDFSQLPATIRNSGADGPYRHASTSEGEAIMRLSAKLFNDAKVLVFDAIKELNKAAFDVGKDEDLNKSTNKYFSVI